MLEEFSTFSFISCSKLVQQNVVCCTSSSVARAQSSVRPLICIRGEVEAEVCGGGRGEGGQLPAVGEESLPG